MYKRARAKCGSGERGSLVAASSKFDLLCEALGNLGFWIRFTYPLQSASLPRADASDGSRSRAYWRQSLPFCQSKSVICGLELLRYFSITASAAVMSRARSGPPNSETGESHPRTRSCWLRPLYRFQSETIVGRLRSV